MKPSINKKTKNLLNAIEESSSDALINFNREADPMTELIINQKLKIKALHFHKDLDLMLIVINNGKVLKRKISTSERLSKATSDQLNEYEISVSGLGIHWPSVDEDLSLKGFLEEEILNLSRLLS
jgi:hypothetical protein